MCDNMHGAIANIVIEQFVFLNYSHTEAIACWKCFDYYSCYCCVCMYNSLTLSNIYTQLDRQ